MLMLDSKDLLTLPESQVSIFLLIILKLEDEMSADDNLFIILKLDDDYDDDGVDDFYCVWYVLVLFLVLKEQMQKMVEMVVGQGFGPYLSSWGVYFLSAAVLLHFCA